ncbi:hypothetical protein [Vibrio phage J14]|nr:hypothetical protein [Vibrio phage J14]
MQISVNTLDGLSNGLLAAIAKTEDASKVQEWGYLAIYATQEASAERTELKSYAVRKINTVFLSDNSDSLSLNLRPQVLAAYQTNQPLITLASWMVLLSGFLHLVRFGAVSEGEGGGGDALGWFSRTIISRVI